MHHHPNPEKKPTTFLGVLWNIAFVFFYPIITTFALLFVGVVYIFSSLSHFFSRFSTSKEKIIEVKKPEWEAFAHTDQFEIEHLLIDEIMFGPAYYKLRTKPETLAVAPFVFGEFKFECFGGVLLQKWNTVVPKELPDFDLVFFHGETAEIHVIDTIKAFSWNVEAIDEESVLLKWFTGSQGGEVKIHKADVLKQPTITIP